MVGMCTGFAYRSLLKLGRALLSLTSKLRLSDKQYSEPYVCVPRMHVPLCGQHIAMKRLRWPWTVCLEVNCHLSRPTGRPQQAMRKDVLLQATTPMSTNAKEYAQLSNLG